MLEASTIPCLLDMPLRKYFKEVFLQSCQVHDTFKCCYKMILKLCVVVGTCKCLKVALVDSFGLFKEKIHMITFAGSVRRAEEFQFCHMSAC